MTVLTNPPLVEVLRADTTSVETAILSLLEFYNPKNSGRFNYLRAVKTVRCAYKGLHRLDHLLMASESVQKRAGYKANQDVIALACPVAFRRTTQVFDLGKRFFPFGRERYASYRIPFFFTENFTVKLYYLQYRKNYYISEDVYGGMLTVHRRYLLDQEFYGDRCEIEYVDCSASDEKAPRQLRTFQSSELELWSEERLKDQLGIVAAAMEQIELRSLRVKRIRPLRDIELPLFD